MIKPYCIYLCLSLFIGIGCSSKWNGTYGDIIKRSIHQAHRSDKTIHISHHITLNSIDIDIVIIESCEKSVPKYNELAAIYIAASIFDSTRIDSISIKHICTDSIGNHYTLFHELISKFYKPYNSCKVISEELGRLIKGLSPMDYNLLFVEYEILQLYLAEFNNYTDFQYLLIDLICNCDLGSQKILGTYSWILNKKAYDTGDSVLLDQLNVLANSLECIPIVPDTIWFGIEKTKPIITLK